MTNTYTDEIQRLLDALPSDIRGFVYSADMNKVVQDIGQKSNLHVDQLETLEDEVVAAMIGLTRPEEFSQNLVDALNIDPQKAAVVAKDVNDLLFIKIRGAMGQPSAMAENEKKTESVSATPAPVSPLPATPAVTTPAPTTPTSAPATVPPPKLPSVSAADMALTQTTINKPKTSAPQAQTPPKPDSYKADPYREPVE